MEKEFEFWIGEIRYTGFCEVHVKSDDVTYDFGINNIEVEEHKAVDMEQDERAKAIKAKIFEFLNNDKTLIEDYDEYCRNNNE